MDLEDLRHIVQASDYVWNKQLDVKCCSSPSSKIFAFFSWPPCLIPTTSNRLLSVLCSFSSCYPWLSSLTSFLVSDRLSLSTNSLSPSALFLFDLDRLSLPVFDFLPAFLCMMAYFVQLVSLAKVNAAGTNAPQMRGNTRPLQPVNSRIVLSYWGEIED